MSKLLKERLLTACSSAIRQEVRTHTKSRRWGPRAGRTTGKDRLLARNHSGYATERDTQRGGAVKPRRQRRDTNKTESDRTKPPHTRDGRAKRGSKTTVERGSQTDGAGACEREACGSQSRRAAHKRASRLGGTTQQGPHVPSTLMARSTGAFKTQHATTTSPVRARAAGASGCIRHRQSRGTG